MKKNKNKKLLIFSAHPDDHLSCAGTALFLKDKGFEISEVVFTGGEKSVDLTDSKKSLAKTRQKELEKASRILGTKNLYTLGLPDSNVTRTPELLDKVIEIIRAETPSIVICQNPKDYHFDHRQVGKIVTEAVDRAGWSTSPELGKKHKTSVGLYMGSLIENAKSDVIVNTTKYQEKKLEMMAVYGSQVGSNAFQLEEGISKYFGYYLRTPFAESFEIMQNYAIRLDRLMEILSQ